MKITQKEFESLQPFFKKVYLEGYKAGVADLQFEIDTGYPRDQYLKAKKIVDEMFGYKGVK